MWVVGDNLWISVDKLLVKVGGCFVETTAGFSPTTNTQSYAQKRKVKVDKKMALNSGFLFYPQLSVLVTTNTSIDIQQVVREPLGGQALKFKLGL
ncbi:MAG: hypothetical protein RLY76_142 [Actinomycetota bacterium]